MVTLDWVLAPWNLQILVILHSDGPQKGPQWVLPMAKMTKMPPIDTWWYVGLILGHLRKFVFGQKKKPGPCMAKLTILGWEQLDRFYVVSKIIRPHFWTKRPDFWHEHQNLGAKVQSQDSNFRGYIDRTLRLTFCSLEPKTFVTFSWNFI